MSDMTETLQELLERRLRDLGRRRGRGESISLREAWQRLPEDAEGRRTPTYETFRRIRQAGHTNINDETAAALATMLDVPVAQVYAAAGIPPRLGRFELPARADALAPNERAAVVGIVNALLDARAASRVAATHTQAGDRAGGTETHDHAIRRGLHKGGLGTEESEVRNPDGEGEVGAV